MTGSYSVSIKKSAEKELRKLPKGDLGRVVGRIKKLAENPRPPGNEKVAGQEKYRIRPGDSRILSTVDDERRAVEVVKIGHRREVYRK